MLLRTYNLTMNKIARSLNIVKVLVSWQNYSKLILPLHIPEDIFKVKYNQIKSLLKNKKLLLG